ncbi:MAG: two-component system response regulator AtoC [Myxococcota bacterium]|jgi:two-component system response regulator AtoC
MSRKPRILVVDDERNLRTVLCANLKREGYEPIQAVDGLQAIDMLKRERVHVVVTDLRMPGLDGMGLLGHIASKYPLIPVIMITAHGTVDTAVAAMKNGAFDYVTKPFEQAELKMVIAKAVATSKLSGPSALIPVGDHGRYGMIGTTDAMGSIFRIIDKVADTPTTVLITGESGTGKELISRALHSESSRAGKPFIRINCAAIPKDLIESELFGYEKGAFTGAVGSKPGRFELANEGTLFLDEIGEIPLEMQVKLLRALQEQEFERVGGIRTINVDVRLIAATNQNLEQLISEQRFREDLYYRLNVVPIRAPALRERKPDIKLIARHIIAKYNERLKKSVTGLSRDALSALMDYDWPGNIRELENVLERMMLFASGEELTVEDVPVELRNATERPGTAAAQAAAAHATSQGVGPLKELVKETTVRVERDIIVKALDETNGNVTKAAQLLQISRKSLQNKMKEYELRDDEA